MTNGQESISAKKTTKTKDPCYIYHVQSKARTHTHTHAITRTAGEREQIEKKLYAFNAILLSLWLS